MSAGRVACLLLAAGSSRRMGGGQKVALPFGSSTVIRRCAENLLDGGMDDVLVVLGNDPGAVRTALQGVPVDFVENRDFRSGLGSSIAVGAASLPADVTTVAVALGDEPRILPATIAALREAHETGSRGITVPLWSGRRGHPVFFRASSYRTHLQALGGDVGARQLLQRFRDDVLEVPVDDPGVVQDLDTAAAYARLSARGESDG